MRVTTLCTITSIPRARAHARAHGCSARDPRVALALAWYMYALWLNHSIPLQPAMPIIAYNSVNYDLHCYSSLFYVTVLI